MAVPAEVQAAMIIVAGHWARYLGTIEPKPKDRRAASIRLLRDYRTMCRNLQKIHGTEFTVYWE